MSRGWIGVDFDGTLAEYDHWRGSDHTGAPVEKMLERVKSWLDEGKEIRIFTARVWPLGTIWQDVDNAEMKRRRADAIVSKNTIEQWCLEHIGRILEVTCIKDFGMVELWDDRAVTVIANTGTDARLI